VQAPRSVQAFGLPLTERALLPDHSSDEQQLKRRWR
jgi:hypothetical protein